MNARDLLDSLPFVWPAVAACVILVLKRGSTNGANPWPPLITVLATIASMVSIAWRWPSSGARDLFEGSLRLDGFGLFISLGAAFCGLMTCLSSGDYLKRRNRNHNEFYALLLFAVSGMSMMGMSMNLLAVLLGLEIMSVAFYVLTGLFRDEGRSIEAAIKYYITGSFATGLFVFGTALIFGATGSLDLAEMGRVLRGEGHSALVLLGSGFLVAAFAFKIAAVPFHMWLPDVYEGAPTNVTGFMATGVKFAAFGTLVRVFQEVYQQDNATLRESMWWIAVMTMVVGNVAAIAQSSVKRMLAYSAIAHAGYLLIGIVAMTGVRGIDGALSFSTSQGVRGILFYLLAYAVTNVGAFAVLSYIERVDGKGLKFDDLVGLRSRQPLLALVLSLFMLSLAGIPGTAGFVGKLLVFGSAVDAQISSQDDSFMALAILGILNSLVGLYYYLRVPVQCYIVKEPDSANSTAEFPRSFSSTFVILTAAILTVWLGIGPNVFGIGVQSALDLVGSALVSLR